MKRILEINIPNEADDYFPMNLYVVEVPAHFEVGTGWVVPTLSDTNWSEMYAILEKAYDAPTTTHIQIDKPQADWAEKGRQLLTDSCIKAGEDVESALSCEDDLSLAAMYVHKMILEMTGCAAIFSWRW